MSFSKYLMLVIGVLLAVATTVGYLKSCRPLYNGPVSDHFDGTHFYSEDSEHSFWDMVKWFWEMETIDWPEWVDDPHQPAPIERVGGAEIKATFINHATILIQMDSLNILTDPIWSERASPFSWAGTKRVRAPGIRIEDLPGIDLILISHDHYDHLDLPTLRQLSEKFRPQILVGLGVKSILDSEDIPGVIELDWWQEIPVSSGELNVMFVPARHNSGRVPLGENRTLWGGYVIEGSSGRVYFAGDTGYGQFLESIKDRFGEFRLTVFPIGNYEKRWIMKTQHMNPEDAVMAHRLLNSEQSMGIHYSTFLEHPEQTIDAHEEDLAKALAQYNMPESAFWILQFGEGRYVP